MSRGSSKHHQADRLRSAGVLAVLILLNAYLEYRGAFEPFALATYDWLQRSAWIEPLHRAPLVTTFTVGAADLERRDTKDEELIARMVQIAACGEPALIGIDWRSARWNPAILQSLKSGPAANTNIVWARELSAGGELQPVAGQVALPGHWTVGVGAVVSDSDRAVRRHVRWFPGERDSFSWRVSKIYCALSTAGAPGCSPIRECAEGKECESEGLLNYTNGAHHLDKFPASLLLAQSEGAPKTCSELPQSGASPFLKGRIVLIGDAGASDLHATPYEQKSGVHIMGHAIQSDLFGGSLREQHGVLVYALHLVCVVVIMMVNKYFPPFWALGANILGIPALALAASWWTFSSLHHWFDFIPILGGVVLHQLYEQAHENHELRKGLT